MIFVKKKKKIYPLKIENKKLQNINDIFYIMPFKQLLSKIIIIAIMSNIIKF